MEKGIAIGSCMPPPQDHVWVTAQTVGAGVLPLRPDGQPLPSEVRHAKRLRGGSSRARVTTTFRPLASQEFEDLKGITLEEEVIMGSPR